jgi:uncharacterized membrane protein YeaQ/YmgE (transglycosylase-associated protein family)
MDTIELIRFLVIGAIAGWLAGTFIKGGGFGLPVNIVIGIIGAVIGNYLFGFFDISALGGSFGSIVSATAGALLLLLIVGIIKN